jgi:hypothetical protein
MCFLAASCWQQASVADSATRVRAIPCVSKFLVRAVTPGERPFRPAGPLMADYRDYVRAAVAAISSDGPKCSVSRSGPGVLDGGLGSGRQRYGRSRVASSGPSAMGHDETSSRASSGSSMCHSRWVCRSDSLGRSCLSAK